MRYNEHLCPAGKLIKTRTLTCISRLPCNVLQAAGNLWYTFVSATCTVYCNVMSCLNMIHLLRTTAAQTKRCRNLCWRTNNNNNIASPVSWLGWSCSMMQQPKGPASILQGELLKDGLQSRQVSLALWMNLGHGVIGLTDGILGFEAYPQTCQKNLLQRGCTGLGHTAISWTTFQQAGREWFALKKLVHIYWYSEYLTIFQAIWNIVT